MGRKSTRVCDLDSVQQADEAPPFTSVPTAVATRTVNTTGHHADLLVVNSPSTVRAFVGVDCVCVAGGGVGGVNTTKQGDSLTSVFSLLILQPKDRLKISQSHTL